MAFYGPIFALMPPIAAIDPTRAQVLELYQVSQVSQLYQVSKISKQCNAIKNIEKFQ